MTTDEFMGGEAAPRDEEMAGIDVTDMVGLRLRSVLDPAARGALEEIERRAHRHVRRAQAENVANPQSVKAAAAFVRAYNAMADIMGIDRV